jgi:hypothetical protein
VEVYDMISLIGNTVVRASDIVWGSADAAPTVPTGADTGVVTSSGGLAAAATLIKISYQFTWGEGPLSASISVTPTAHAGILLTGASLVPPAGALYTNIYTNDGAGGTVYKLWGTTDGTSMTIISLGQGNQPSPTTTGALDVTQNTFAVNFLGVSNQRKVANLARIFGSSLDNQIMVCRAGVVEFDTASASYNPGDFVGPDKDVSNILMNQQVVKVASESLAIGRVLHITNSNTKVMVELMSRYGPDLRGVN